MNKKFLKHYMETEPEGTSKKYIFLVDNQDIAMNIVMSSYQALYLGKLDNQSEVGKALEQLILRFEREPKNDPELSRFHKFDSKGKVTGVRDMEIVDYIVENI